MIIILNWVLSVASAQKVSCKVSQFFQSGYWNGQQCIPCQSFCTCTSYGGCDSIDCPKDMALVQNGVYKYCAVCPRGCDECASYYQSFKCSSCMTSYELINNACYSLSSLPLLTTTMQSQYQLYRNEQDQPTSTSASCFQMDTKTSLCKACQAGTFLNNYNFCEYCPNQCISCSGRGVCDQCKEGYYWNPISNTQAAVFYANITGTINGYRVFPAGACQVCPILGSAICFGTNVTSCIKGYYFANNTCNQCQQGCNNCTSSDQCSQCNTGYYESDNKCSLCLGNTATYNICKDCNSEGCLQCEDGLQLLGTRCIICNLYVLNCRKCTQIGFQYSCIECLDGTYLSVDESGIGSCVLCPQNSLFCYNENGQPTISQCQQRYLLVPQSNDNSTLVCSYPYLNCATMQNAQSQQCLTCATGSFLINYGCYYCQIANCVTCMTVGVPPYSLLVCQQCFAGYYTLSQLCQPCVQGCQTCSSQLVCTKCYDGYQLTNSACYRCQVAFCISCSSSTQCTECQSGYYLYDNGGIQQCLVCRGLCQKCSPSGITCEQCVTGTFSTASGGCTFGQPYCAVYDENGTCTDCIYGFHLVGFQCRPCIDFYSGFVCSQAIIFSIMIILVFS